MAPLAGRRELRWIERALIAAGILCLAWVSAAWIESALCQRNARTTLDRMLVATDLPGEGRGRAGGSGPDRGGDAFIGQLDIPRLGLSVVVLQGDDDRTLRTAAGHLPETPLPWEEGNVALAGHRDTYFRPLRNVREGDAIELVTLRGRFEYRVRRMLVVGPDDVWVIGPSGDVSLTLITCYPFTYVGSAPRRFIVQAERISRSM